MVAFEARNKAMVRLLVDLLVPVSIASRGHSQDNNQECSRRGIFQPRPLDPSVRNASGETVLDVADSHNGHNDYDEQIELLMHLVETTTPLI